MATAAAPVMPEIFVGPVAVKVTEGTVSVPPLSLVTVLASVRVGSLLLVKLHVKSAPAFTFALGIVSVLLTKLPMLPVFVVIALFASVQDAEANAKPVAGVSVNVTAEPKVEILTAAGLAGAAVPAVVVVIPKGVLAKLVCAKVNTPPTSPTVVLVSLTVGVLVFVKVQVKSEPAFTLASGIVSVFPANEPIEPVLLVIALFASVQFAAVAT